MARDGRRAVIQRETPLLKGLRPYRAPPQKASSPLSRGRRARESMTPLIMRIEPPVPWQQDDKRYGDTTTEGAPMRTRVGCPSVQRQRPS